MSDNNEKNKVVAAKIPNQISKLPQILIFSWLNFWLINSSSCVDIHQHFCVIGTVHRICVSLIVAFIFWVCNVQCAQNTESWQRGINSSVFIKEYGQYTCERLAWVKTRKSVQSKKNNPEEGHEQNKKSKYSPSPENWEAKQKTKKILTRTGSWNAVQRKKKRGKKST